MPVCPEDRGLVIITGASSGIGAATALIVAKAILWLLSDKASFTTGALIDAGGGV
jgi:NAD(P)-dependent dehydrogenase (short-subunit alcohol dehydrogenase family)